MKTQLVVTAWVAATLAATERAAEQSNSLRNICNLHQARGGSSPIWYTL